jgi:flagellar basal-body rod protein FlgF
MLIAPYPYHSAHTYLGMMSQEQRLNVIANNLANANTPGYKKDVPVFDPTTEGYVVKSTKTYFGQGNYQQTGNSLDLALAGPGFFQIETPNGIRYTRNGAFTTNQLGEIVTQDGYPVVGGGVIPENTRDIIVGSDGRVLADGDEIGAFELVEFEDPNMLAKEGANLYATKMEGIGGVEAENTSIDQGYLETSNVDPVLASVMMIDTMRTYEALQKIAWSVQEATQRCINDVGQLM